MFITGDPLLGLPHLHARLDVIKFKNVSIRKFADKDTPIVFVHVSHCLEDDKDLNVELQISEQSRRRPSGGSKVSSRHPVDDFTDESKILDDVGDGDIINGEGFIKNIHRTHVKVPKTSKSSSETNLNFNNNFDETNETFSRKANSRKSLPVGHVNLAFINEDDAKDPYLLI